MAPSTPLSLEGAKTDLEKLKARNVDLSGLLPPLDEDKPAMNQEDSLERSYDFVRAARAALQSASTGDVDDAVR